MVGSAVATIVESSAERGMTSIRPAKATITRPGAAGPGTAEWGTADAGTADSDTGDLEAAVMRARECRGRSGARVSCNDLDRLTPHHSLLPHAHPFAIASPSPSSAVRRRA